MVKCEYCGRERDYGCLNTKDMEDFAELGERECFYQLARLGGGEKGLKYVIANCDAREKRIAQGHNQPIVKSGTTN